MLVPATFPGPLRAELGERNLGRVVVALPFYGGHLRGVSTAACAFCYVCIYPRIGWTLHSLVVLLYMKVHCRSTSDSV